MRSVAGIIVALSLTVAVAACEDDATSTSGDAGSGASGAGSPLQSATQWCDAVIRPMCEGHFACCTDPMRLDQYGGTVDNCIVQETADCYERVEERQTWMDTGWTWLDGDYLSECAAKLESLASGPGACSEPPLTRLVRCTGAFKGLREPGSACDDVHDDSAPAVCKDGYCGADDTCTPYLAKGQPCDTDDSSNGFCNPFADQWCIATSGTSGVCGDRLELGAPCVSEAPSETWACYSLACEGGVCVDPVAQDICVSNT